MMTEAPKLTLKERQWNLREDAILDAASELMGSKGYNAMTMDDVSNLVGISKATLYQHFSSKHDLVISVACRTVDRAFVRIQMIDHDLPAGEQLAQLIDRVVEVRYATDSPPFIEAVGELVEVLGTDHPFMQKEQRNVQFIANVMQSAAKAEALVPGISVFVAVHILLGTLRSMDLEKAIENGTTTPSEIAETITKMLIRA